MVVLHTYPIAFVPSDLCEAKHRNTRDRLKVRAEIINGGVQSGGQNRRGCAKFCHHQSGKFPLGVVSRTWIAWTLC